MQFADVIKGQDKTLNPPAQDFGANPREQGAARIGGADQYFRNPRPFRIGRRRFQQFRKFGRDPREGEPDRGIQINAEQGARRTIGQGDAPFAIKPNDPGGDAR